MSTYRARRQQPITPAQRFTLERLMREVRESDPNHRASVSNGQFSTAVAGLGHLSKAEASERITALQMRIADLTGAQR
jgi:hypothetical protein